MKLKESGRQELGRLHCWQYAKHIELYSDLGLHHAFCEEVYFGSSGFSTTDGLRFGIPP